MVEDFKSEKVLNRYVPSPHGIRGPSWLKDLLTKYGVLALATNCDFGRVIAYALVNKLAWPLTSGFLHNVPLSSYHCIDLIETAGGGTFGCVPIWSRLPFNICSNNGGIFKNWKVSAYWIGKFVHNAGIRPNLESSLLKWKWSNSRTHEVSNHTSRKTFWYVPLCTWSQSSYVLISCSVS